MVVFARESTACPTPSDQLLSLLLLFTHHPPSTTTPHLPPRNHNHPRGVLGAAGLAGVSSSTGPDATPTSAGAVGGGGGASSSHHRCLVLDASYRPINTVSWFKAVMMDVGGKVRAHPLLLL